MKSILVRILFIWIIVSTLVFLGFEAITRIWFPSDEAMKSLHVLHFLRGLLASLLCALAVGFYVPGIIRASPLRNSVTKSPLFSSSILGQEENLRHHAKWFIELRWMAVVILSLIFIISGPLLGMLPNITLLYLFLGILSLAFLNYRYQSMVKTSRNLYRFIVLQVIVDLIVLSGLIEFSGGLENPFYLLYLIHVIIGAVVLKRRDAFRLTAIAWSLLALVAVGQMMKILPHFSIDLYPHHLSQSLIREAGQAHSGEEEHAAFDLVFVVGRLGALLVTMGGTVYFVTLIMDRLHEDRQRLVEVTGHVIAEMDKREKMQAKLITAGKMATIGEFTGRIAHEINNPVAIISAKAKLLLADFSGKMPEKVESDLLKIDKHAERIATITRGLLAFSRSTVGKKEILDIRAVIQASVGLVEHPLATAGVTVVAEYGSEPIKVRGNFNELQQVAINILNNAIDAMPGGGSISVRVERDRENNCAVVSITDTGTGISSEVIPFIFDPLFTTKPEGRGTGLGLAICQGLVQNHDGSIEVISQIGQGSTFVMRLPVFAGEGIAVPA